MITIKGKVSNWKAAASGAMLLSAAGRQARGWHDADGEARKVVKS